eukprot:355353-Chlamydomonas_euryale.AAC.4
MVHTCTSVSPAAARTLLALPGQPPPAARQLQRHDCAAIGARAGCPLGEPRRPQGRAVAAAMEVARGWRAAAAAAAAAAAMAAAAAGARCDHDVPCQGRRWR